MFSINAFSFFFSFVPCLRRKTIRSNKQTQLICFHFSLFFFQSNAIDIDHLFFSPSHFFLNITPFTLGTVNVDVDVTIGTCWCLCFACKNQYRYASLVNIDIAIDIGMGQGKYKSPGLPFNYARKMSFLPVASNVYCFLFFWVRSMLPHLGKMLSNYKAGPIQVSEKGNFVCITGT